jgi:hypothetical protein
MRKMTICTWSKKIKSNFILIFLSNEYKRNLEQKVHRQLVTYDWNLTMLKD